MRVESGTHWADISEEPWTWGQRNKARDAASGKENFYQSFAVALVTMRVTAWSEPGDPADPQAWLGTPPRYTDGVDDQFADAVFEVVLKQWAASPDPNAPSGDGKSSPSPQDSASTTQTTSS